jgi:hypothetical protein
VPGPKPDPEASRLVRAGPPLIAAVALLALWSGALPASELLSGRDTLMLLLPLKAFIAERLGHGALPLWYPYDGLGFSMAGALVPGLLDPLNLLLALLPPDQAVKWMALLCLPLGGAGAYVLARARGVGSEAAWLAAVAFGATGYLASQSVNLVYLESASRLPWVLAFAERCARDRSARNVAGLAIALASLLWAGDPESLALAVLLVLVIAWVRQLPARAWLTHLAPAALLALCLVLPLLLPALETYGGSVRAAALAPEEALSWSLHPLRLLELALGSAFELQRGQGLLALRFGGQNQGFWSESVFLGTAVVALALHAPRARTTALDATIAGVALLLALGRFGGIYGHVPPLMHFRYPEKLVAFVALAVSMLAAAGLERIGAEGLGLRRTLGLGLGLLSLGLLAALGLPRERFLLAQAAGILLLLVVASRLRRPWRGLAVLALAAVELAGSNRRLIQHADRSALLQPPALAGLRPHDRICSDLSVAAFTRPDGTVDADRLLRWQVLTLQPALSGLHGLRSGMGLVPALPREIERLCSVPNGCADACGRFVGSRFSLVLPADAAPLLALGYRQVGALGEPAVAVLEDLRAPPLASVRPARAFHDPWQLEADLHFRVLEAADAAFVDRSELTSAPGHGEVTELHDAPGDLVLRASADDAAILAVREAYSPGWHATIDGRPAPVLAVNLGMLGLRLPRGEHHVELRFTPRGWPWALIPYALAWAACLALAVRRRNRPSSATPNAGPAQAHGQPGVV